MNFRNQRKGLKVCEGSLRDTGSQLQRKICEKGTFFVKTQ